MQQANKSYSICLNDETNPVITQSYSVILFAAFQFLQIFDIKKGSGLFNRLNTVGDLISQQFVFNWANIFVKRFVNKYNHSWRSFFRKDFVLTVLPVAPFLIALTSPSSSVSVGVNLRVSIPIFLARFSRSCKSFLDLVLISAVSIENKLIKYNS